MKVLHISPINMTRANGFRFSVPGLVSAQNKVNGTTATLMNIGSPDNLNKIEADKFDFRFVTADNKRKLSEIPFNNFDIVVFHGVYIYKYISIYKRLIKFNIPYIIVPRVSLTKGAQGQKILKKQLSNLILFNKFINNAICIHFLTNNEMELSKQFKVKSFIVGNGVKLPTIKKSITNKPTNITFIGRYDINHKGLDLLVEAITLIENDIREAGIIFNFYGSDYKSGRKELDKLIDRRNIKDIAKTHGSVFDRQKEDVLLKTDVFIATSRFEGHPQSVIEAMSYGIPCIVTPGTNMKDIIVKHKAGWGSNSDYRSISETISEAISDESINEKGINSRKLVEENYLWENIGNKTIDFYKKLLKEDG